MLQGALTKLSRLWPGARLSVVTYAPERLRALFPAALPVVSGYHRLARGLRLPSKLEYGPVQAHKILAPRAASWSGGPGRPPIAPSLRSHLMRALGEADVVVAAGGGYINSTFWVHAAGVLEALRYAQLRGKRTALLGQGLGPFEAGTLPDWAARTLRRADLIALREGRRSPGLLDGLGVAKGRVRVTGDDAVEMAFSGRSERLGEGLGLNIRSSGYAGATHDAAVLAEIGSAVLQAAERCVAPVVPVPISFYDRDADMLAIARAVGARRASSVRFAGVPSPQAIARLVSSCRVIVSGSYHAAVFAAAQGLPVVCLTGSPYYDLKFEGLAGEFPGSCVSVDVRVPGFRDRLTAAVTRAWDRAEAGRAAGLAAAARQVERANAAYAELAAMVDAGAVARD